MKARAFVLACLLAGLPAAAQTLLLVVQENAGARPLPPPFAVREGISGDLFDAGYIVLDAPGSYPFPAAAELAQMAQSAGADIVLEVATDYSDTLLTLDMLRISARTTYALIDSTTSAIIAHGTREATNKDRERDVSRSVLGGEIGKDVAAQVRIALRAIRP
jgi:hypothetical protein